MDKPNLKRRINIVLLSLLLAIALGFYYQKPIRESISHIFIERGDYYFNGGAYNLAKAERFYHWALWLDREVKNAHLQLARIFVVQGKLKEAIDYASQEISLQPDASRAYYIRGLAQGLSKRFDEAERDFKKILELNALAKDIKGLGEGGWAVYNDLAWIQFQKGNYREVEKTAQEGLEKYPNNAWLLNDLGLALVNLKQKKQAKKIFDQALLQTEKLTVQDIIKAYPGNDPAQANDRRMRIISNIKFNQTLTMDN